MLLTTTPLPAHCQPQKGYTLRHAALTRVEPDPALIKPWICAYAVMHHVSPSIAMAVAHVESRVGSREFRCGPMGRGKIYSGPMGIRRTRRNLARGCDDVELNIAIGCNALHGIGGDLSRLRKRLKGYNEEFDPAYWSEVKMAIKRYRKEGWL